MMLQPIVGREQREPTRWSGSRMIRRRVSPAAADATFEFGRFCVLRRRRELLADGVPVELGTRAFDILMVLIEADGSLVTKDELLSRVWPGIVVEQENLKVQISALRKALGDDRDLIRTEFGRGYRFTAAIRSIGIPPECGAAPGATELPVPSKAAIPTDLSAIASKLAGLEAKLAEAVDLLTTHQIKMPRRTCRMGNARAFRVVERATRQSN